MRRWSQGTAARFACLIAAASTLTLAPHAVSAQSGGAGLPELSPVVTTVDPCVPVDLAHFRRLLSIELGTSIDYQPSAPREPGRTWVHVTCGQAGIVLNLEDGVTGKSMSRVLDAREIEPADSTRLLALAVAEFVVASWVELRAVPKPSVPAVGALPPSAAKQVAGPAIDRKLSETDIPNAFKPWQIALGAGIDTFTSHAGVMPTGSLRFQMSLPPVAFTLGGDIGYFGIPVDASDGARAGTIDVIRASGVAALLFGGDFDDVEVWLGPGVRFGVLRLASESRLMNLLQKQLIQAHGGLLVLGRVSHRFAQHFSVGLELELGAVTLPVEAALDENSVLAFSGAWFSAGLRAALVF